MIKREDFLALPFFLLVIAVVIFPLLSPGYIITLDVLATEKLLLPKLTSINYFFSGFLYLLHLLMPAYYLQKIILFLILFLSGWGMFRLVSVNKLTAKLFGGLIYMVNPFIYERIVSGQWSFALGYALFPWIISATVSFAQSPSIFRILILALETALLANLSLHFLLIFSLFFLIFLIVFLILHSDRIKIILFALLKLLLFSMLFNLNWIAGSFISPENISSTLSSVGHDDLVSFQSFADPTFGLVFNLLSGYGFWVEASNYFISPKSLMPLWPLISVIFVLISLYGFYISLSKKKQLLTSVSLGIFFIFSLDLAIGVAVKHFSDIALFLYDKLFLLRGLRESQKLIAVVIFCYAFFGAVGLENILNRLSGFKKISFYLVFLMLPIIYTLPMLWGFWGQLQPVFYPQSWKQVNTLLNQDKDNFTVVFFPWHQYMKFRFNGSRIAVNPAEYYFDKPVLSSRNYETAYLNFRDARPEGMHIEGLLTIEREGKNLLGDSVSQKLNWGESLAPIGLKYIMLAKEADWRDYIFLDTSSDLKKVYEDNELVVYQNLNWGKNNLFENYQESEFMPETLPEVAP